MKFLKKIKLKQRLQLQTITEVHSFHLQKHWGRWDLPFFHNLRFRTAYFVHF